MLDKVSTPLTSQIISDYILEKGYTNYFNITKAFSELLETDLIHAENTYHSSHYQLTNTGKETIDLFYGRLSPEIRNEIHVYLEENHLDILDKMSTFTDYRRTENGEYLASCSIKENGIPLFELSLRVSSEDEAAGVCNQFVEKQQDIFTYLTKELL